MLKNIYEIFEEFKKAPDEKARRKVLVDNRSQTLITFLQLAFDPRIKFTIKEIPKYKPSGMPPGMGYTNMGNAITKTYLFIENHPERPAALTDKRRDQILTQILESLEDKEAETYTQVLKHELKVPHLTAKLVEKAFPNIFNIPIKVSR